MFAIAITLLILEIRAGGAMGAGTGALAGRLLDFDISDDFIRQLAQRLRPNSSALFLLVRRVKPDEVLAELEHFHGHVLRSTLSPSEESRFFETLARQQQSSAGTTARVPA